MNKQRWSIHFCALDAECRGNIGWCWRLEINTPRRHLGIALRPADRYARIDGSAGWITSSRHPTQLP